jgi:sec-independent protein translocase protein TatA
MVLDDPVVWILIIAIVVFLFGANKIPSLARSLGQARREFDRGWRGIVDTSPSSSTGAQQGNSTPNSVAGEGGQSTEDPLVTAAQREGIDTRGKTREQIASELSWKLRSK